MYWRKSALQATYMKNIGNVNQNAQPEKAQISKRRKKPTTRRTWAQTHVEAVPAHQATDHMKAMVGRHQPGAAAPLLLPLRPTLH